MLLFILRHGHAEAQAETDALRPLSASGREELARNLSRCQAQLASIEEVLVSPLLRAKQTYELACTYLPTVPMRISDLLKPGGNPHELVEYLAEQEQNGIQSLLLISHLPLVGSVIDSLCGSEPGRYRMSTASLACLQCGPVAAGCASVESLHHARP